MRLICKYDGFNLINGEKRFTKDSIYVAKIRAGEIIAMDDKGEWSVVSRDFAGESLLSNHIFTHHFSILGNKELLSVFNNKQTGH